MTDSLKFGTSGLRGLARDLVGPNSARYATAFVEMLVADGRLDRRGTVLVGRDLRESSPAISDSVAAAIARCGPTPIDCGEVPTPALALAALTRGVPAIMVTGSHIPADRNGLKFYSASGEIDKADEQGIVRTLAGLPAAPGEEPVPAAHRAPEVRAQYLRRYLGAWPSNLLAGQRIGVYQHSSVARDLLVALVEALGGEAVPLGRTERFVAIDTEAVGPGDVAQCRTWVLEHGLDALVSTDGDADRPLLVEETGALVRGDTLGILTARHLGADAVVTPVTSNSSIEGLGAFARVVRTRVGSPYVLAGMAEARAAGARLVVGFEANGGVLLGSDAGIEGRVLPALPTRDAVLPILAVLAAARAARMPLSRLVATLPTRVARSDRLEHVPQERSAQLLAELADPARAAVFFAGVGTIAETGAVDGLRFVLASGDVVHYRPSGNAPELRCYTEAGSAERADALLAWGLAAAERAVR